ncbi:autophagy protein-like protein Apg9 [Aaosphaeria arxii CBS 175.79]|uniref:Autophagy-related protein 9 n=1 Tax=Aaosphaeria arxii CBS 175.79 TaxID=1450172 RepID=A0A6A5XG54_9PLEO|nr:autophagy protein-like protein Apg9 [Aaosphaeria arxii CBS 175.79]KAF2012148.1 autophagy protein-like protein Apg9 [Aaosphaeria arxii CBS 175.79]
MMASNLLSRLLPTASDERFPSNDPDSHHRRGSSSTDERHDMDIDEENFEARFEAQDLENLLADASASQMTTESTAFLPPGNNNRTGRAPSNINNLNKPSSWRHTGPPATTPMYDDEDVPESLLLEGGQETHTLSSNTQRHPTSGLPPPVPGPTTEQTQAQWDATRRQQRLHDEEQGAVPVPRWRPSQRPVRGIGLHVDPKERALWRWVNVSDLDTFLVEVYEYYDNKGIYSILLRRFLRLLQTAFVVSFITFLTWCIDYSVLKQSHKLSEVLVPKCTKKIHGFWIFALWMLIMYWLWSFVQLAMETPRLRAMHDFYHYLLDIPDRDIQTVQWQLVVARIMALRDLNLATASNLSPESRKLLDHKSRQRLDAVDIASRLMRRDNYMIALFNKDIIDVTIPIPFLGDRYIFSETTKWHVQLAIMDYVFSGPNGTFNQDFLKERNRRELVRRLQSRFLGVGIISVACAPFTVSFVLVSYLFKYFTEYHKDPSQLNNRDFTELAKWKFREFNELPHIFKQRLNMAYPYANLYLAQFPKDKTEQVSAFVAFISGAFAFVLVAFTLLDSEMFLSFEITPGKTAIFWLGILTAIYRIARNSSPQEDQVADPTYYLQHVNSHTRYEPEQWKERLHTDQVRAEFSHLYQPKVLIFAEEILSMLVTPFLLIFRLPQCSERIVDFFREFSIVVDGLGVVCSHSMFPFKKGREEGPGNRRSNRPDEPDLREDYFKTKDDKMLKSYYGFLDTYAMDGRRQGPRNFHPPPQFPNNFGNMSQTAGPFDHNGVGNSRIPAGRQSIHHGTPIHGPTTGRDVPIGSILLDPHHQPSASTFRNSPRQAPTARYRSSLQPLSDRHAGDLAQSRQRGRIEEESTIGDSWRTSRLAQDDDEEEEATGNTRGGVLQLLRQFSQAQTEGKAAGVGI